ncbi:hypothetical protein PR003_g21801 [Phytophthora rubi]|uniref:Uncharacterized protein n=1 Tax=Phytophthora rubi TaxID=129364 RepID=A0A6A4D952_9STRA|nr:hypothetical protein PR003_g21801 [Phytophthora rubi]
MRGLVATAAIPEGEVIGEYFGHLQLFGPPCRNGPVNEGYRVHLRTWTTGNKVQGGAHTSHDGQDNGADDNQLLDEVNSALNGDDDQPQHARAGIAPVQCGDHPLGQPNDGDVSDTSPSPDEISGTPNSNFVEDPSAPPSLQAAPNSGGRADSTVTVATSQGFVPVEFAAVYDVESSDEDTEEQDSQSVESTELVGVALTDEGPDGTSNAIMTATPTPPGATSAPTQSTTESGTPTSSTPRGVGRPRVRDTSPIVSVASPDGSELSQNPERIASDAAEAERFRRMSSTCDRLGGRDLRVLRDNFEEMGGGERLGPNPSAPRRNHPRRQPMQLQSDSEPKNAWKCWRKSCAKQSLLQPPWAPR